MHKLASLSIQSLQRRCWLTGSRSLPQVTVYLTCGSGEIIPQPQTGSSLSSLSFYLADHQGESLLQVIPRLHLIPEKQHVPITICPPSQLPESGATNQLSDDWTHVLEVNVGQDDRMAVFLFTGTFHLSKPNPCCGRHRCSSPASNSNR
jgi:hypothetical protein